MPSVRVGDASLHFTDQGAGDPIVLLHGATQSSVALAAAANALAARRRVIALDLRGSGRSSRAPVDLAPSTWIDDIDAVLDHLGLDAAHFVAPSLGGRIAARYAHDRPGRVRSLAIDSPVLGPTDAGGARLNATLSDPAKSQMADQWREWHGDDWVQVIEWFHAVRNRADVQAHLDVRPLLAHCVAPTLIVRTDQRDDVIHPFDHALEWHAGRSGSWLWIAPAVRPTVLKAAPVAFARVHDRFLEATWPH